MQQQLLDKWSIIMHVVPTEYQAPFVKVKIGPVRHQAPPLKSSDLSGIKPPSLKSFDLLGIKPPSLDYIMQ